MANARSPTPIWGAASPTQAGRDRMVSSRSAARAKAPASTVPTLAAGRSRNGSGRARTGRTAIRPPTSEDVGLGGVQPARHPQLAGLGLQVDLELVWVAAGR